MGRKRATSSASPLKTPGFAMTAPSSLLELKASLMASSCSCWDRWLLMSMARRLSRVGAGGAVGAVVVDMVEPVVSEVCDSEVSVGVSDRCGSVDEGLGVPGEEPTVAGGAANGVAVNSEVKLEKASKS